MSEMIFQEVDFFIASFLWGIFLLVIYDGIRIFRRTFSHGRRSVAAEDMLFWLLGVFFVFRMMYEKNDGIIRGTAFLSIGLGMLLYHYTLSRYVVKLGYGIFGKPVKKICLIFRKGLKKLQKTVKLIMNGEKSSREQEEVYDKSTEGCTKRSKKGH